MKTILCFGAHAPDPAICAGGALAKYAKEGDEVIIVALTMEEIARSDETGKVNMNIPPEEIIKVRKEELKKSCEILGAKGFEFLDFRQEEFGLGINEKKKIALLKKKYNPDLILVNPEESTQYDHYMAGKLVREAMFIPSMLVDAPFSSIDKELRFYTTENLLDFKPEIWIDITDTIDKKVKAVQAFTSIMEMHGAIVIGWFGMDYILKSLPTVKDIVNEKQKRIEIGKWFWDDVIRAMARTRGWQSFSSYRYAEAQRKIWPIWS